MKRIPFKCKFNHITIKVYDLKEQTKGTIICPICDMLAGTEITYYNTQNLTGSQFAVVRRGEMAVRI